jgi:hypothetical protein
MFHHWHRVRDGTMSRAEFRRWMTPVRERVDSGATLGEGTVHDQRAPWHYRTTVMTDENQPIEYKLVRDGTLFEDVEILETKIEPTVGNDDWHVRIWFRVEEDLVESCAFGLIYVLTLFSFHDGRPRGVSGAWFEDNDHFVAADMLRHLTFEGGKLRLYIDYLRGRCIKTTVEVGSNGHVLLETLNRGQAATRWIDRLKGKKFLEVVASS